MDINSCARRYSKPRMECTTTPARAFPLNGIPQSEYERKMTGQDGIIALSRSKASSTGIDVIHPAIFPPTIRLRESGAFILLSSNPAIVFLPRHRGFELNDDAQATESTQLHGQKYCIVRARPAVSLPQFRNLALQIYRIFASSLLR